MFYEGAMNRVVEFRHHQLGISFYISQSWGRSLVSTYVPLNTLKGGLERY